MTSNPFRDKSKPPQDQELSAMLGNTFVLWNQLKQSISSRFAPATAEWGFSSPKTGWGLRLKQNMRTVLSMIPNQDHFIVSFALGEKAVKDAHNSDLPDSVLGVIDNAPRYAEGRGVRLHVRSAQDVFNVEKLAVIKMKN
jgi:hypothetical protein